MSLEKSIKLQDEKVQEILALRLIKKSLCIQTAPHSICSTATSATANHILIIAIVTGLIQFPKLSENH